MAPRLHVLHASTLRMLFEALSVACALALHAWGIEDVLYVTLIVLFCRRAWMHYIRGHCGTMPLEGLVVMCLLYLAVNVGREWKSAYTAACAEHDAALEQYNACRDAKYRDTLAAAETTRLTCTNATARKSASVFFAALSTVFSRGPLVLLFGANVSDVFLHVRDSGFGGILLYLLFTAMLLATGYYILHAYLATKSTRAPRAHSRADVDAPRNAELPTTMHWDAAAKGGLSTSTLRKLVKAD